MTPTTEAGKRLLLGLPSQGAGLVALNTEALIEAIAAIEAEARSAVLNDLRVKVEEADFMVERECSCHAGQMRLARETHEYRVVILDLIDRALEP